MPSEALPASLPDASDDTSFELHFGEFDLPQNMRDYGLAHTLCIVQRCRVCLTFSRKSGLLAWSVCIYDRSLALEVSEEVPEQKPESKRNYWVLPGILL